MNDQPVTQRVQQIPYSETPNATNPMYNNYMMFRLDSTRLIELINKRFKGEYFNPQTGNKEKLDNAVLKDWAAERIITTIEPYLDPNFTLSDMTPYFISGMLQSMYVDLFLMLYADIEQTGLSNIWQIKWVVDIVIDIVSGSLNRGKNARTILADHLQVQVLQSDQSTQNTSGLSPLQGAGLWGGGNKKR